MNDESCARHPDSTRSEFWRALSYQIGDEHADRLTWWVDLYLWWYGIAPARLRTPVPGGFVPRMDGPIATTVRGAFAALLSAVERVNGRTASALADPLRDLERAIDRAAERERKTSPPRVFSAVDLGRLRDLIPDEDWEVVSDAKSAWS